jgi:hypothetical protein
MSEPTPAELSKQFSARAIPLLKEYLEKFRSIAEEAKRIREVITKAEFNAEEKRLVRLNYDVLTQLYQRLRPPATELAREVSQKIEHGNLDELDRVELMLRLAEFEASLLSVQRVFALGPLAA